MNAALSTVIFAMALNLSSIIPGCSSGGASYVPVRAAEPAASATPTAPPSAVPNPNPTQTPSSGGLVVIAIPTPAPLVCSPAPVTVPVDQTVIINCNSQGYDGPYTWSLSDPTVASVQLATGTLNFFYINGLKTGTTTLSFQFSITGSGSVSITVP